MAQGARHGTVHSKAPDLSQKLALGEENVGTLYARHVAREHRWEENRHAPSNNNIGLAPKCALVSGMDSLPLNERQI
jgi:hypothetical protein